MMHSVPNEDALATLSALQHYLFCPRQCALIHCQQEWAENVFTVEGTLLHEKADSGKHEKRKDVRIETGVLLRSYTLGLVGKADVVEYHRKGSLWLPFPVEYKRGKPKKGNEDRVQVCAQALCLEEMHGLEVPEGALFYGTTRRRESVIFSDALRKETKEVANAVIALLINNALPEVPRSAQCKSCSLVELCGPELHSGTIPDYMQTLWSAE